MPLEHSRNDALQQAEMLQVFFATLQELYQQNQYSIDCIWNFDETPFRLEEIANRVTYKLFFSLTFLRL